MDMASAIGAIPGEWAAAAALIQLVHSTRHSWSGGWLTRLGATNRHFYLQVRARPAWHGIGCHSVSKKHCRGSETFLRRSAKMMLDPFRVVMSCSCLCVGHENVNVIEFAPERSMFRMVKWLRWLSSS